MPTVRLACALVAAAALLAGCGADATDPQRSTTVTRTSATAAAAAPVAPAATTAAAPTTAAATAAAPKPAPVNYCAHNTSSQLVRVSLRVQHAWMCAGHRTVFSTGITSGMAGRYTSTPTGRYEIQSRTRNTVLTLNTGAQYDVKYWIPFDAPLFGFHDSSWQHFPYGGPQYRTRGSHGCIHMPLQAMKFLYRWADIGASVHIT